MTIQQANEAIEKGENLEAIKILSTLLLKDKANIQLLALRGIAYRREKDYSKSLNDFSKAIEIQSSNADLYTEKAVSYFHQGKSFEALQEMNKAAELDPENPYRYSSRAYIKDSLKDLDGAIQDYEKAIELDPKDSVSMNNLGLLEEKRGRLDKAKEHFDKSDEIEGIDYSKYGASTEGGKSLSKKDAQKEVKNVEKIAVEEKEKNSVWRVIASVFTSKDQLKEFIQFLKGAFKKKKD